MFAVCDRIEVKNNFESNACGCAEICVCMRKRDRTTKGNIVYTIEMWIHLFKLKLVQNGWYYERIQTTTTRSIHLCDVYECACMQTQPTQSQCQIKYKIIWPALAIHIWPTDAAFNRLAIMLYLFLSLSFSGWDHPVEFFFIMWHTNSISRTDMCTHIYKESTIKCEEVTIVHSHAPSDTKEINSPLKKETKTSRRWCYICSKCNVIVVFLLLGHVFRPNRLIPSNPSTRLYSSLE